MLFDVPRAEFLKSYFPHRPLLTHGAATRFGALAEDPSFRSAAAALGLVRDAPLILGYLCNAGSPTQDQAMFANFSALGMFENGWSLNLDDLHRTHPLLREWTESLRVDLGLPPHRLFCCAIVSPPGAGVPKHFDSVETLTVQLFGKKRWSYAPCPEVENPGRSVMPAVKHNYRDGNARPQYMKNEFSTEMPADAKVTELVPGSTLFLPRGYWHQTVAETLSISLNFVIRTPTQVDALKGALDRELTAMASWRAPFVVATPESARASVNQMASQLRELARSLEQIADRAAHWAATEPVPGMGPGGP